MTTEIDNKAVEEFKRTHNKVTVYAHQYKNSKGKVATGYQGIRGEANQAAMTHASFSILGMATVKGKEVSRGNKARDLADLKMIMGTSAPAYWVREGLLEAVEGGYQLSKEGLSVLHTRLIGKAKRRAFNTTIEAVRLVTSIMRKGGKNDIGFNPTKITI